WGARGGGGGGRGEGGGRAGFAGAIESLREGLGGASRPVPRRGRGRLELRVHVMDAHLLRAVGAAEHASVGLHSVTDDTAPAVLAGRRHRVDRALEAIERPRPTPVRDLERLSVIVSAH